MNFIKNNCVNYNSASGKIYRASDGWLISTVFFAITFFILLTFYIIEINVIAAKKYEIKSDSETLENLKTENQRLFIEKSRLSSFESLRSEFSSLGFLETKEISYLDIFEPAVAVNR